MAHPHVMKLLPQPLHPQGRMFIVECRGGTDKGVDGHRHDTIPIANELISVGWWCQPIFYSDAEHDRVKERLLSADGFISRVNPGSYSGVTMEWLEQLLTELAEQYNKVAMPHPKLTSTMGSKDALVKVRNLSCGMQDTYAYYDVKSFKENFPRSLARGLPRVLKQNRGSQGEGIWVCKLRQELDVGYGTAAANAIDDATELELTEACDNHKEIMPLGKFMSFCEQYLDHRGLLVDQRFLPRIVEGELRVNMIYDTPIEIIMKKPMEGGISATLKSGALYECYDPKNPKFARLLEMFLADLPNLMSALGMPGTPLPLIWAADFILGEKNQEGEDTYYLGEFNCSCVGIAKQLHLVPQLVQAAISVVMERRRSAA
mmetsp:Transcript_3246/g.11765  ORF Transcript_3246/g.11765 Transcript_3246/m.11765 type:complete len:374 (+) Transcript_3246:341-1462(+)